MEDDGGRYDVVVVGAGIVGLATALKLLRRSPDLRLAVVEAADRVAAHQTGHNSGVVHAGLYYAPGSLKARLCRAGKEQLEDYAAERGIPIERCGKLVVALSEGERPRLEALAARGTANGVPGLELLGPERCASASRTPPASRRCGAQRRRSSTSSAWPRRWRATCATPAARSSWRGR